ncbi:MAG: ComEC/Rec2 family competence protein [Bdellovibrionales bacterium]
MNLPRILGHQLMRERDRWLLWTPVAIGAGIVVYFKLPFEPPLWTLAAAPFLAILIFIARHRFILFVLLLIPMLFALGFSVAQIETRWLATPLLNRPIGPTSVTGRLMLTEIMPKGVRLTLKDPVVDRLPPEQTPPKVRIRIQNKTIADVPPPGTLVNLWAQLSPFTEPVMPHTMDFRWLFYFRQTGAVGWSTSDIRTVDENPPPPSWYDQINLAFERARLTLTEHVYKYLSGDVAAMTAARMHGEQSSISEPVIEAMRVAGLVHLLSTSGYNVTIMGILIYLPLRAFFALIPWIALRYPIKKWAACGAILSTIGYTMLTGSPAATVRSMIMTGIAMLAIILDRPSLVMRLAVLSAAMLMMVSPDAILGPSFQMSFAAVLCLIAAHERAPGWVPKPESPSPLPRGVNRVWRYLAAIVVTSLIGTAATTPFTIYHFGTFSFYGFAANAVAIPLDAFWIMPLLLMAYITVPLGWDGPFLVAAGWGTDLMIRLALLVRQWPYAMLYAASMPTAALGVVVIGGLWLCLWRTRWRLMGVVPVLIGMLYPFYTPVPDFMVSPDGKMWAARLDDGRLAASTLKREKFITEQWQEGLGHPELVDARELLKDFEQLRCDKLGCVYRKQGHVLAMPQVESAALEDCRLADTVIAPFLIDACEAPAVIDDDALWRHGAHVIYFTDGNMRIVNERDRRGMRPWSPGWKWERKIKEE